MPISIITNEQPCRLEHIKNVSHNKQHGWYSIHLHHSVSNLWKVDTTLVNLNFVLRSVSNRSGHPRPLSKGGFEVQAKISKREGLKKFWIRELSNPEFFQTLPFCNFGLNLKPPSRGGFP